MRRVFALFCVLALGGCASLETRMREQRADRESIEASFSSVEPRLRSLAAESCTWSRTEACEERLERMALEDPDDGVRASAIRTLGRICGDAARRALLRIAAVAKGEEAIVEAAVRCPAADLTLVLEGAARSRFEGTPEERKAWLAWLEGVVAQPPPREEARALRDRVARQLRRENAEAARAMEISRTREKAWAALDAGELEEAAVQVAHLAALGAPSGDLLRRIAAMDLQRTRRAFDEALRDGDPDWAEGLLREVPALQLQDPTLAFRAQVARYDMLLPSATWVEDLARSGKVDEARAERRKLLERGGEAVLLDQARASRRRSEQLVEKGRFAAAWRESWSLRETESVAAERFMVRFGVERWRREGLE
ncbi:MAG TPA: HEAT repeat domain-containing protein, partial [Vulgatibacter sp.]|nr:HEAT repeat domain-containing protein [Vulgatibacter sp.]